MSGSIALKYYEQDILLPKVECHDLMIELI